MYLSKEEHIAVSEGNINKVKHYISEGWNINEEVKLDSDSKTIPFMIALMNRDYDMMEFMLKCNAKMDDKKEHAFLYAVEIGDEKLIRYIAGKGAKINVKNEFGRNAYDCAYHALEFEKINNFDLLRVLGISVHEYAGAVFRRVILNNDTYMIDYLLEHNVNVNFNKNDSVFTGKQTPITVAIRQRNFEVVKKLIAHGADLTIETKFGRPYQAAKQLGYLEIAEYIKQFEDPILHDLEEKKSELKAFHLSDDLLQFLQGDALILRRDSECTLPKIEKSKMHLLNIESDLGKAFDVLIDSMIAGVEVIEFLPWVDLIEFKYKSTNFLILTKCVGDYPNILLLWHPKKRIIAYYDESDVDAYGEFATFAEFIKNPFLYIDGIFTDEYRKN